MQLARSGPRVLVELGGIAPVSQTVREPPAESRDQVGLITEAMPESHSQINQPGFFPDR